MSSVKFYSILGTITLVLLTGGCKLGPNYERSFTPEIPEQYRFDPAVDADTLPNLKWWELVQDPVLDTLILKALANNRDIRVATARIEEAVAQYGFTRSDQYPKIDAQASYAFTNNIQNTDLGGNASIFFVAPTLSYELNFWGKFRRSNEAARADILATQEAHRVITIGLISDVATLYFQLLDFKNRLEISEQTLESRIKSEEIIQARFDEGTVPEIDLNQAQIQKEIAAQAVPAFTRQVAQTENLISILIGEPPGSIEIGKSLYEQDMPFEIPAGLPANLLNRRPDVLQAEYQLMSQNAFIGVAEAARWPTLNITAFFGANFVNLPSAMWSEAFNVSGSLFSPLFNFGKNKRRVEVEKFRTEQALNNYEQTVLFAFKDVEDALISVKTYREEFEAALRRRQAAANARDLSQERYDGGVTSYLEVLEQERSYFEAELISSESLQRWLTSYVNLYKALGGGWITEQAEEMEVE